MISSIRLMPAAANASAARPMKPGGGGAAFVAEDLAVGPAAVVVDGGVHVVVADASLGRVGASVDAPAAAGGYAAEFLDVDVDEVTWPFAFVADRCRLRGADAFAGQRVAFAQARHIVAAQDAADGPRGNAQQRRQSIGAPGATPDERRAPAVRSPAVCASDSSGDDWSGPPGQRGPRRRSGAPSDARTGETHPSSPPHGRRESPQRGPARDEQPPPFDGQTSVTMRHEDLRVSWAGWSAPPHSAVFTQSRISPHPRVTNVLAKYT